MLNRLAQLLVLVVGCVAVTLLLRINDSAQSRPEARQETPVRPVVGCLSVPDWAWMRALVPASVGQALVCLLASGSVAVMERSSVPFGGEEGSRGQGTNWLAEAATQAEERLKGFGVPTELPPESLILSPGFLSVLALLLVGYVYFKVRKP
jgi:hypothetical protein